MTIFFTADLHLGHVNLAQRWRTALGHDGTVEGHDAELIRRWNATVTDEDHVLVLGDLAMGNIVTSLEKAGCLNGDRALIPGNHDRVWPHYKSKEHAEKFTSIYEDAGFYVGDPGITYFHDLGHLPLFLSHFPPKNTYPTTREDGRDFSAYQPSTFGVAAVLHGHTHSKIRESGPKSINVGVDAWDFAPAAAPAILNIIQRWSFSP